RPEDDPRVAGFLDALAETAAASRRRLCVIAGADLAHMGPRFGDADPVSPAELQRIAREDRAMLQAVEAGDAGAVFDSAAADVNGDWLDEGVQITHAGILANLRSTLRRDGAGHFIQTRVRIPVAVDDVPFVVVRLERRGETLHAVLNDGSEQSVDPATVRLGA